MSMIAIVDAILPSIGYELDYDYPDGDRTYLCMKPSLNPVISVSDKPLEGSLGVAEYRDGKLYPVDTYRPLHKCNNLSIQQTTQFYYILIDGQISHVSRKE
jgi:hypothetical protein